MTDSESKVVATIEIEYSLNSRELLDLFLHPFFHRYLPVCIFHYVSPYSTLINFSDHRKHP
eukprot:COSAG02_NODE_67684_length_252_cov_0.797386_1_plen_60_part_10